MEQGNDLAMGYVMGRDGNGYGNGFGGFGGDWLAILVILALLGGNNGFGFGGNGGNNMIGYELGKAATQADVASGFNNSAVLSNLNDIKLGQQTGFAAIQQTLCQGFNGINQGLMEQSYNTQNGFNQLSRQLSDCCCELRETSNRNAQRLLDYAQAKENQALRDEVLTYKFRESQAVQNAYLVDQLRPTARPAYPACNPYESAWGWNRGGNCGPTCCNG
jgi:hypothetical protein